jgi:ATP-dependent DNA helicase RecG
METERSDAVPDLLSEPLKSVVGGRTATVLERALDQRTVGDLLRYYPRRYAERGELTDLADLRVGEEVTVLAEIAKSSNREMRERRGNLLEVWVTDGRASLLLTYFNQRWLGRDLVPGRTGLFSGTVGEVNRGRQRVRQLISAEFELLPDDADEADASEAAERYAGRLIPIYHYVSGLRKLKISGCVALALDSLAAEEPDDPLPAAVRSQHRLMPLVQAFGQIHRPESWPRINEAKRRLKWDEALPLQVVLAQRRRTALGTPATPRRGVPDGLLKRFDRSLPFKLTPGQEQVSAELAADLAAEHPMHRLLQGEVGSGKTVVALRAMLITVDSGGQAVLLAPTEVLAQQHHRSVTEMLGPLARAGQIDGDERATRVALLTGSQGARERRENLEAARSGEAGIVIGTHAVIEESVAFRELGLVVIDEQHRFGVEQRDALRAKAEVPPHLLVMTATPIPRTVAMTVFGDLETSVLAELPLGRSPIATHVVPALEKPHYLTRAWQRIREEVAKGHQAYVVCPRIADTPSDEDADADPDADTPIKQEEPDDPAESEHEDGNPTSTQLSLDVAAPAAAESGARRAPLSVEQMERELTEGPLSGLRIGVLHGRLAPEEKDIVMTGFSAGRIDVLIATTVIEVGVNVPNATVMAVLDADRFGVSQLHQLRGRVGRGSAPGLCLLVTEAPEDTPARERLDAVAGTLDGFELSRIDLEQRREGDVLGASQSGRRSSLRLLTVLHDEDLIGEARAAAAAIVDDDPELAGHPALAAAVAALTTSDRADFLAKT